MSSFLEIICVVEAAGQLDEPVHKCRRYWIHPIHTSREQDMRFEYF
jgi:hypothetical protein